MSGRWPETASRYNEAPTKNNNDNTTKTNFLFVAGPGDDQLCQCLGLGTSSNVNLNNSSAKDSHDNADNYNDANSSHTARTPTKFKSKFEESDMQLEAPGEVLGVGTMEGHLSDCCCILCLAVDR